MLIARVFDCTVVHTHGTDARRDLFGLFVYGAGSLLPSDVRAETVNGALCEDAHPHDLRVRLTSRRRRRDFIRGPKER